MLNLIYKFKCKFNVAEQHHACFTANQEVLQKVDVQYETLPGWNTDTSAVRTFEELPENARKYVLYIEEHLGVPGMVFHL